MAAATPSTRLSTPADVTDRELLADLQAQARTPEGRALLQFRSRTAAHQYLPLYELVRRHVPRGDAMLDWGAGNGHFSFFLLRNGYRVTSYRLAETRDDAWLADPGDRVIGDGRDVRALPFDDDAFDAVSSIGVLEHVADGGGDFAESLRELHRVTREGGALVVFHLPQASSWIEAIARRVPGAHAHTHPFRRAEIESLLRETGWRIRESARYAFLPRNFWGRFPSWGDASRVTETWDHADQRLARLLPPLCQNFAIVAGK